VFLLSILLLLALPLRAADWPHWRGPARNGVSSEVSGWESGGWPPASPLWEARVGIGSSSPVVAGGRLYVM
jgi:hypothetical protein